MKERQSGDWIRGVVHVRASMQSVDAQRGRWIVIVTIVLGALIILGLNCFTLLAGRFHPLLLLKGFVAVFWFRAIWLGNETARRFLVLLLWGVALICAIITVLVIVTDREVEATAVTIPVGVVCGLFAFLLGTRAVDAFLRAQRGVSLNP